MIISTRAVTIRDLSLSEKESGLITIRIDKSRISIVEIEGRVSLYLYKRSLYIMSLS